MMNKINIWNIITQILIFPFKVFTNKSVRIIGPFLIWFFIALISVHFYTIIIILSSVLISNSNSIIGIMRLIFHILLSWLFTFNYIMAIIV